MSEEDQQNLLEEQAEEYEQGKMMKESMYELD